MPRLTSPSQILVCEEDGVWRARLSKEAFFDDLILALFKSIGVIDHVG